MYTRLYVPINVVMVCISDRSFFLHFGRCKNVYLQDKMHRGVGGDRECGYHQIMFGGTSGLHD